MGYRNAGEILPVEVIELIQQYVDGENIYIPRRSENRQKWGLLSSAHFIFYLKKALGALYQLFVCFLSNFIS